MLKQLLTNQQIGLLFVHFVCNNDYMIITNPKQKGDDEKDGHFT